MARILQYTSQLTYDNFGTSGESEMKVAIRQLTREAADGAVG
jgi:hypothetical protein